MVFKTLPHNLVPVIVDPAKLPAAFEWLLAEMETRFRIFAKVGSRGLIDFNRRRRTATSTGSSIDREIPQMMPHIVVIISELADPMMAAGQALSALMVRLARGGGAAGIHLIAATERVSAEGLLGGIDEALPARIVLKSRSRLESRIALGFHGAESLLGCGDMLYRSDASARIQRGQAATVGAQELLAVCEFLKRNGPPQWAQSVQEFINSRSRVPRYEDPSGPGEDDEDYRDDDELVSLAYEALKRARKVDSLLLQRRLRIGYGKVALLLDILEEKGVVGPAIGDNPREILVDLDTYEL
jgi:DNA segregation ATPase FtsK/SpoIIIE, S-DNA-T family